MQDEQSPQPNVSAWSDRVVSTAGAIVAPRSFR